MSESSEIYKFKQKISTKSSNSLKSYIKPQAKSLKIPKFPDISLKISLKVVYFSMVDIC